MAKLPPTKEQLAARTVEPDVVPPFDDGIAPVLPSEGMPSGAPVEPGELEFVEAGADTASSDDRGYAVPPSPIARAERVLATARANHTGVGAIDNPQAPRPSPLAGVMPVVRNYANEAYVDDLANNSGVVDSMAPNMGVQHNFIEPVGPQGFREFETEMQYEQFMREPVVIRIHATRDKNEPPKVFVGVNGDTRWLLRDTNYRIPRFLVEALAKAQEMSFKTEENPDPRVDNAMTLLRTTAMSYSFSVLHDPNPHGRRWLERVTRQGS